MSDLWVLALVLLLGAAAAVGAWRGRRTGKRTSVERVESPSDAEPDARRRDEIGWYLSAFRKYAVFDGRASRTEYWSFVVIHTLVLLALVAFDRVAGTTGDSGIGLFFAVGWMAGLMPALALTARRLHDTGRNGAWILFQIVPIIGPITVLVFLVQDSQPGDNLYGENPKTSPADSPMRRTRYARR